MFLISFVALLALSNGVSANEFTGAVDDRYCDPGNWDTGVPGPGDDAVIKVFDVIVDCDVTSGTLKGPGWEEDPAASLTVNAGSAITFAGGWARDEEGESPWVINVNGSMTVIGNYRFADESIVTINVSGAGASMVLDGSGRAGDNGGTGFNLNADSGVFVQTGRCEIGDDGGGVWNISGTASVSFLADLEVHLRAGSTVWELNLSDNAELACAQTLSTNDKDGGYGTAYLNVSGGILSATQNLELGDNGPGNLTVTGGLVSVGDTLELNRGDANLIGGEVRADNIDIDNGVMHIHEGPAALILNGNKLAQVAALVSAGKLVAQPCDSMRGISADYGVTNPGKTTVISTCSTVNIGQAWNPSPADGAIEVRSLHTDVVLAWNEGDYVGLMGRNGLYLGTDYDTVDNATEASPEWEGFYQFRGGPASVNIGNLPLWVDRYWRIDEYNQMGAPEPVTKGLVWKFTTGCEAIDGDVNMDCLVNFLDYAELAATFGEEEFWPE